MAHFRVAINTYQHIVEIAYKRGLIIYSCRTRSGVEGDHFLVCPPMIIKAEEVDSILSILKDNLEELAQMLNLPVCN